MSQLIIYMLQFDQDLLVIASALRASFEWKSLNNKMNVQLLLHINIHRSVGWLVPSLLNTREFQEGLYNIHGWSFIKNMTEFSILGWKSARKLKIMHISG